MAFENQLGEIQEEDVNDAAQAMIPYSSNGLGDILRSQKLGVGMLYTVTFNTGKFINLQSEDDAKREMSNRFLEGDIVSVKRKAISGRYIISFVPSVSHEFSYWLDTFYAILYDMGFPDAVYVTSEGGAESSQPGGLPQITSASVKIVSNAASDSLDAARRGATKVVQAAGSVVEEGAKQVSSVIFGPLFPVLVIAGGLAVGYFYMQSKTVSSLTPSVFKKNPRGRYARRGYR